MLKSDEILLMKKLGIPDNVIDYEAPAIPERVKIDPAMVETDTRMYDIVYDIEVKIDRGRKDLITRTIQNIGGALYEEITVDEVKVFEMLQKNVARKPVYIPRLSIYDMVPYYWKCPNCNNYLAPFVHNPYCHHCGQKLDWENWKEEIK